mgnify:CR=1 FL=1
MVGLASHLVEIDIVEDKYEGVVIGGFGSSAPIHRSGGSCEQIKEMSHHRARNHQDRSR